MEKKNPLGTCFGCQSNANQRGNRGSEKVYCSIQSEWVVPSGRRCKWKPNGEEQGKQSAVEFYVQNSPKYSTEGFAKK